MGRAAVGGDVVETEVARLGLTRGGHIHLGLEFYPRRPQTDQRRAGHRGGRAVPEGREAGGHTDQAAAILRLPTRARREAEVRVSTTQAMATTDRIASAVNLLRVAVVSGGTGLPSLPDQ